MPCLFVFTLVAICLSCCIESSTRRFSAVLDIATAFVFQDVLISGLLNRDLNPAFNHIRGLKDIVECK